MSLTTSDTVLVVCLLLGSGMGVLCAWKTNASAAEAQASGSKRRHLFWFNSCMSSHLFCLFLFSPVLPCACDRKKLPACGYASTSSSISWFTVFSPALFLSVAAAFLVSALIFTVAKSHACIQLCSALLCSKTRRNLQNMR